MSIRAVISERMIGNKKRKGENKAGVNEWITMIGNCGSVLFNKETVWNTCQNHPMNAGWGMAAGG